MPGKTAKILLALVVLILGAGAATLAIPPIGYNDGHRPKQPIPFSHRIHATDHKIPCLYCHVAADKSPHATVPSLNVCMNCHLTVATGSPWIKQLQTAYENNQSIEWKKVHMLPDFVRFNHKRHVRKGVSCQTCHGAVEGMDVVSQEAPLSMGWCVNCHRKPENNASINCSTCHY
jgi:hypothetical protein